MFYSSLTDIQCILTIIRPSYYQGVSWYYSSSSTDVPALLALEPRIMLQAPVTFISHVTTVYVNVLWLCLQGTWWYKSIKYSGDKILLPTTQLYFYFINKTPNMVFKSKCCLHLAKIMIRWTLTSASCFQNF